MAFDGLPRRAGTEIVILRKCGPNPAAVNWRHERILVSALHNSWLLAPSLTEGYGWPMEWYPSASPSDVEVVARGLIELERSRGAPLRPADEWTWEEIRGTPVADTAARIVEELRHRTEGVARRFR
jgi:hypothetical protein